MCFSRSYVLPYLYESQPLPHILLSCFSRSYVLPYLYEFQSLLPLERHDPVNVNKYDHRRHEIPEQRLHPGLHLQALARIGLSNEVVPTPSNLVAAKQREHQGPQRKDVCRDDEIPEIQPGSSFREGLEVLIWRYWNSGGS